MPVIVKIGIIERIPKDVINSSSSRIIIKIANSKTKTEQDLRTNFVMRSIVLEDVFLYCFIHKDKVEVNSLLLNS